MRLLTIIAAVCLTLSAYGQTGTDTKKKSRVRATASKSAAAKSAAKKAPASKAAVSKPGASKTGAKSKKAVAARRPPLQQQPTTDRYKEIQQALADKGYFRGTADGAWGPESVEALKRFQREQNLDPDGKIGALSLMALGLGPRRGTASAQAADIVVDPPPVAQPRP